MKSTLNRRFIQTQRSSIHGYGVFATENIKAGEVIEECYTLECQSSAKDFDDYFYINKINNDTCLLPLGFGAIYNHSPTPNARYNFRKEQPYMIFVAIKPIKKGEEIFVNYGSEWFTSRGAIPIIANKSPSPFIDYGIQLTRLLLLIAFISFIKVLS